MPFKKPPKGPDHLTRRFGASPKDREGEERQAGTSKAEGEKAAQLSNGAGQPTPAAEERDPAGSPGRQRPVVSNAEPVDASSRTVPSTKPVPKAASENSTRERASTRTEERPEPIPRGPEPRTNDPSPSRKPRVHTSPATRVVANGTVEITGYVYAPLTGAAGAYDQLVRAYGEKDALRFALNAGLEDLDRKLSAGAPVEPMDGYATRRDRIRVKRRLPADAADRALQHIDPFGMLSQYPFGTRLWKAALGLYLARD